MTTTPARLLLVMLASALAACSQPKIVSGAGPVAAAPTPGGRGPTDGPGFSVSYPEVGAPDHADGPPPTPGALGEGPSCAGESHEGKLVPLDLLFLLDISGS